MKRSRLIINVLLSVVLLLFSSINVSANDLNIVASKANTVDYSSYNLILRASLWVRNAIFLSN